MRLHYLSVLCLAFLLASCAPSGVIVITATPLQATQTPFVITSTPVSAPTGTPIALEATPTQENCFENCTILSNSLLQTPCYAVTVAGKAMQVPNDWRYTWNPVVAGVDPKDLGNVPPFSKCDGFGLSFDTAFRNGVFGAETSFDAYKGVKYLIKAQYSAQCNYGGTTNAVFNVAGEIVNADGGTTTKLTPQGLARFDDKTPSSGEALWVVQSDKLNPSGVLKIYATFPYGVCTGGSFFKLNAVYMFAVNWDSVPLKF